MSERMNMKMNCSRTIRSTCGPNSGPTFIIILYAILPKGLSTALDLIAKIIYQ
jgi:hypothetical protein